jgi:hypothetical protein
MRKLGQRFVYVRDSIAGGVAPYLSRHNGDYSAEVRQVWHSAGIATYTVFFRTMRSLIDLLTPEQNERADKLPQTSGQLAQIRSIKESDLPWLFRNPFPPCRDERATVVVVARARSRHARQRRPSSSSSRCPPVTT